MTFNVGDKVQLGNYHAHSDYTEHYGQVATVIEVEDDELCIMWQDGYTSILFENNYHDGKPYSGATLVKYHIGDRVAYHPPHYDNDLMGKVVSADIPVIDFDNRTLGWRPNKETIMYLRVIESNPNKSKPVALGAWGIDEASL